ncbi:MAG TPA: NUDIX domain-containing protein, partial [Vicinamibacteria bacterium]
IRSGDGRVAVVREDRRWFLPGGGSLPGETPEQTVAREVLEECGRRARGLQRIGDAIQYFYAPNDRCWYEMLAVFFRGELENEVTGVAECELRWIDARAEADVFFHACHAWAASRG